MRSRITCPHCWHEFSPEHILWVAQHEELLGDPVLGPEAHARFVPTRFTVGGDALDSRGMACQTLACPRCHLVIPRPLVEAEPLLVSIVGVPSSGKSYFLTAMTWELRRHLPTRFSVTFTDADTVSNRGLNLYEEMLFLQGDSDRLVALPKTQEQGELYDQIRLGQQIVTLPKPFLFNLRPSGRHPDAARPERHGRVICMYDNAGESFDAGKDSASSPVTQHLAKSRVLMFLYDPVQDPRFRERCRAVSDDPQVVSVRRSQRQETILTEAAMRVRRYAGLSPAKKYGRPLIVIVPKLDIWEGLLSEPVGDEPIVPGHAGGAPVAAVDVQRVERVSASVRALLLEVTPEFVSAAEDFSEHVVYVPVSALGCSPEPMDGAGLGTRSRNVRPKWVTVPVLYMFARWSTGLIGAAIPGVAARNLGPANGGGAEGVGGHVSERGA